MIVKADSKYAPQLQTIVQTLESTRQDPQSPTDISLVEYLQGEGDTYESFLEDLGVQPNIDTISNLMSTQDVDRNFRWLVPEIILDALRVGLRKAPIYPDFIASEQSVNQTTITIPWIQMSDATPEYIGEGETIPLGGLSMSQKSLKLRKLGKGIKITDEIKQYVSLNVVSIFLQDMGVKLGQGLDKLLINTLINGEQADGSESSPVVGVASTVAGITYADLVRVWVRMSRLSRNVSKMIVGEEMANTLLNLPEFKDKVAGTPVATLNLKTPIPSRADVYIHGAVPDDVLMAVDSSSTIVKYNAQPLMVETERIVSNQTEATYATLTTGFGIIYRDSRVGIDQSLPFASNGFPNYMSPDIAEDIDFRD